MSLTNEWLDAIEPYRTHQKDICEVIDCMAALQEWYCVVANSGYDQGNRFDLPKIPDKDYPGETDCSALEYICASMVGINVPTSGTRYTGTMLSHFTAAGFVKIPFTGDRSKLIRGDILWKTGHTALWTGYGIAEAYTDENNSATGRGGKAGDQMNDSDFGETRISPFRGGWEWILRYPQPETFNIFENPILLETGSSTKDWNDDKISYLYRWEKWSDGTLKCFIEDYFPEIDGLSWEKEFYASWVMEYPGIQPDTKCPNFVSIPHVSQPVIIASSNLMSAQVKSRGLQNLEFYVRSPKKHMPRIGVDIELVGRWK